MLNLKNKKVHTKRSKVAQLAERPAVNRRVGGSSPSLGAGKKLLLSQTSEQKHKTKRFQTIQGGSMVEQLVVNQRVGGSNPSLGAGESLKKRNISKLYKHL